MTHIDLTYNFVSVVVVDNSKIPNGFIRARFCRYDTGGKRIKVSEIHGNPVDRRISVFSWKGESAYDQNGVKLYPCIRGSRDMRLWTGH
eukprot:CAMPEP_0201521496 /NCGR_PEP_ID=MMETSP0161_2-20130828/14456_1 /ASSEMBLY_ACC=CAM_ASM_000251 /TAXON_ID=180227 /ORGANISM="Neoparamoeba aestuarina, Strain SoJaBio B1-5/56/2" /LENGTH=88 /DNA_ID=CAMNT_0047920141 /DNA_START=60 /DNA_END=326 /DNA_ORIENTATION=+